ncbi:DUF1810 domain-containing protein [Nitrosovibrio tenuis]|uniref:Uncharacterized protein, DUF1810 family n=1 Tax=Nitrosovibrio tenuis TaxID=1233 RepID=A0A1H7NIX1_9PROT|nr:DUF1810 domain-containing protein [Nitrosovibrio tenuis]SEL23301.1 Uncharacterized protein, DUF1810 family [Nitrosovibrio tenuis]
MSDPYNLRRFTDAQQSIYDDVLQELREGRKRSHWMWFIFPQIEGLGHSAMARAYAISSREEAGAYLWHPVLGPRLRECARLVAGINGRSIEDVFGYPDYMKFRSSMTLFSTVAPDLEIFDECLRKYFGGEPDPATLTELNKK